MYSRSGSQIRHGYSVIRVSLDDRRDHTVPVGVVAWQTTNPWYGWRWLEHDEKVRGGDPEAHAHCAEPDPPLGRGAEGTLRAGACGTEN